MTKLGLKLNLSILSSFPSGKSLNLKIFKIHSNISLSVPKTDSKKKGLTHFKSFMGLKITHGFSANVVSALWSISGSFLQHILLCNFLAILLKPAVEPPVDSAQDMIQKGLSPFVVPGKYFLKSKKFKENPSGSFDLWHDFLSGSPNPYFRPLANTLKMAAV